MERQVPLLSAAERPEFIKAARSLVGAPFKHRGRSPAGVDCLGTVAYALAAIGREVSDERLYGRNPEPDAPKLRDALVAHFGEPVKDLQPGCVVSMHWHGVPNHVAIVGDYPLGGLSLIHAYAQVGRVIETRLAAPWPRRIVEGWLP